MKKRKELLTLQTIVAFHVKLCFSKNIKPKIKK